VALVTRIYFNAVFGALGGLLGWLLFGIFGDKTAPEEKQWLQMALGGACIGGAIGYFVVSVDALRDRSLLRFVRLAAFGVTLGLLGGCLGILIGDAINTWLVAKIGATRGSILLILLTATARGLGWTILGLFIGMSEGIAAWSLGKFSYSTVGGAIGGFIGGALFSLAQHQVNARGGNAALWGALGLMILGACIGSLSALVQAVFQPASVKVLRGWQEGREYPLLKTDNRIGRDEHADIALFRDMRVEKRHAIIQREGQRYILVNTDAPADYTIVNGKPVAHCCDLNDGDRIQLGNVLLRFQMRAAQERKKRRSASG
jgi:hypothetical protein